MGFFEWLDEIILESSIARENRNRQGVTHYKPSQVGGFTEADAHTRNTLVSGGSADIRSEAVGSLCIAAANAGVPVVILHCGDQALEKRLDAIFGGHSILWKADTNTRCFDPFRGVDSGSISGMIMEASGGKYPINADAAEYIDGMLDFVTAKGGTISTKALESCPHAKMPALLTAAAQKHTISPAMIQQIQTKIVKGAAESGRVKNYFKELYKECSPLQPAAGTQPRQYVSVPDAVKKKRILMLDVMDETNTLLVRLLLEQIRDAALRSSLVAVIDGLSVSEESGLKRFSTAKSARIAKVFVSDDLYAGCCGDNKLFAAILGKCQKWFVFRHKSGASAKKWEEGFGEYVKIDTSYNHGRSSGGGFNWWLFGAGYSGNKGYNSGKVYSNKDEPVVRANQIQKMESREGYVFTEDPLELAHVKEFLDP